MDVHCAVGEGSVNETVQKWARSTSYWELLV